MEFSEKFYNEADTTITLKQIRKVLKTNLKKNNPSFDAEKLESVVNSLMEISGLSFDHFNFIKSIERTITEKLNDVSIDDNSNKNEKTVAGIFAEAVAPVHKAVGFDYLYRTMKELYGKKRAKELSVNMYDYSLGLSDSSNILRPYCYAMDATKLVLLGRDFGQLPSKPAKRVSSYISALCETIHQMSNHLAGAIAIGTLFFDISHLAIYNMGLKLENFNDPKCRKHFENELQQLVHSVNHLSRNSNETPFTNLSLFDKVKLKQFVGGDMSWYFLKPDWYEGEQGDWEDYVVNFIYELQNVFLDYFDKGDPSNNGLPYRFPVITCNFCKAKNEQTDEYEIVDKEFLDNICSREIYRYNIFMSEGSKTASCCRLLSDSEMLDMANQSNSFGAGALSSLGSHRVVTINFNRLALQANSLEEFWKLYDERIIDAKEILQAHKILIQKLSDKGLQPFIANGWINMKRMFSTFGVLGIYECDKTLRQKFDIDNDVVADILVHLSEKVREYSLNGEGFIYNIEQIPSESYAVRLPKADKLIYGEDDVPYELYANQFVPLWEDANIWEKFDVDGKYNKLLTGGGIVHATIGEKVTKTQAKQLINYAVKSGCEHFALNAIYSQCKNKHMSFGDLSVCPVCGGAICDKMTRVVGFFTPVSSWNKVRREWEFPKRTKVNLD